MPTEILGYFSETDFCLVSADEFRPKGDGTLDFVPETLFFLFPVNIGLFQHSLFLVFLFHCRTGKYVVIVRFYITHTRLYFYRPFAKSMLHYVKSHIYKSYIFFTASINLFYTSSFPQSKLSFCNERSCQSVDISTQIL